jgi:hypothetical protein
LSMLGILHLLSFHIIYLSSVIIILFMGSWDYLRKSFLIASVINLDTR